MLLGHPSKYYVNTERLQQATYTNTRMVENNRNFYINKGKVIK